MPIESSDTGSFTMTVARREEDAHNLLLNRGTSPRSRWSSQLQPTGGVPHWLSEWARHVETPGLSLESAIERAREVSKRFTTRLSEDIAQERRDSEE